MEANVGWHVGRLAGADYEDVVAEIKGGLKPTRAGASRG